MQITKIHFLQPLGSLDEFAQAEAQGRAKMQQQIGGQATMPLALVREIELGTLEIGLGTLKTAPAAQSFGRGLCG